MDAALPRLRWRRRSWRTWWIAVALAIAVNLGLIAALAHVGGLHPPAAAPAPYAARSLRPVEPEEPPPPPPERSAEPPDAAEPEAAALALPNVDLPAAAPAATAALELPAVPSLAMDIALPVEVPAFAAIGPPVADIAGPGTGPIAAAAPDEPAVLEAAFDLDRFYPRAARLRGVAGGSRIALDIDAQGRVTAMRVLSSDPPGVFEQALERLARSLRYRPAKRGGVPTATTQTLSIDWTLR